MYEASTINGNSDGTSVERHKPMPFSAPFEHSSEKRKETTHNRKIPVALKIFTVLAAFLLINKTITNYIYELYCIKINKKQK